MQLFIPPVDFCGLLLASLALVVIGRRVTEGYGSVRQLSGMLASLWFLCFLIVAWMNGWLAAADAAEKITQALAIAATLLGGSQIALVALCWLYRHSVGAMFNRLRRWQDRSRWQGQQHAVEREQEHLRRRLETHRAAAPRSEEVERQARDARVREEGERRRREDAQIRVQSFLALHGKKMPEMLSYAAEFVRLYMGQDRSADEVEARERQLMEVLRGWVTQRQGWPDDVAGMYAHYREQTQRIKDAHLETDIEEALLLGLKTEFYERLERKE